LQSLPTHDKYAAGDKVNDADLAVWYFPVPSTQLRFTVIWTFFGKSDVVIVSPFFTATCDKKVSFENTSVTIGYVSDNVKLAAPVGICNAMSRLNFTLIGAVMADDCPLLTITITLLKKHSVLYFTKKKTRGFLQTLHTRQQKRHIV
jgi:hypothetical protein